MVYAVHQANVHKLNRELIKMSALVTLKRSDNG
jgi:hypothetical protein